MATLEKRSISIGVATLISVGVAAVSIAATYGATRQKTADDLETTAAAVKVQSARIDGHDVRLSGIDRDLLLIDKRVTRVEDAAAVTNRRLDELLEEVRGMRKDVVFALDRRK